MPGGNSEDDESPIETLRREVLEEIGVRIQPTRLTGIYYQRDHLAGEFIHFVFRVDLPAQLHVEPDASEVAEWGLFSVDALPEPMSASTRLRLLDALQPESQPLPVELPPRAGQ